MTYAIRQALTCATACPGKARWSACTIPSRSGTRSGSCRISGTPKRSPRPRAAPTWSCTSPSGTITGPSTRSRLAAWWPGAASSMGDARWMPTTGGRLAGRYGSWGGHEDARRSKARARCLHGSGGRRRHRLLAEHARGRPGPAQASGPDLANVTLPNFSMPLVTGGVSMPNTKLTPGAVATTDTTKVCLLSDHSATTAISPTAQQQVCTSYMIRNPVVQAKSDIDYLVPIGLGGATTTANMWPAALKGTGFFEKDQLDHVMRDMGCHRQHPLAPP